MKIKYAASFITTVRIIGTFALLLTTPLSASFFVVYALCCVSDILDGYVARKTETTSRFGEVFDSVADFIFILMMLIIFVPLLEWEQWRLIWIGIIAFIRFFSLGIGFRKYRALSFLHTYSNKITGLALACFPIMLLVFGETATVIILCGMSSCSALEELAITIKSRKLDRNIKGLFFR